MARRCVPLDSLSFGVAAVTSMLGEAGEKAADAVVPPFDVVGAG